MIWVVVTQAEQLGQLLPQQGNQRLPLAAGIGPQNRDRIHLGIAADVAAPQLLDQRLKQGAGEVVGLAPAPPSHGLEGSPN